MRNLLWTATAVLVMLVSGSSVLAQVNTVVPANGGGNPPNGKKFAKCTGTYTVPNPNVNDADYVTVQVFEKSVVNGQVTWTLVDTINDGAPAGGNYATAITTYALTNGTEYMFTAVLHIKPKVGGPGSAVIPGATVTWTP